MRPIPVLLVTLALALNAYGQPHTYPMPHHGPVKSGSVQIDMRATGPMYHARTMSSSAPLDTFFTKFMATYGVPGMAACIIKNNKVVWEGYYGYADLNRRIPVSDSSIFYLASISKTLMATALMQLYEAGRFRLDDSVNGYLPFAVRNPNYPNTPITFRMLLTHTSSIQDNWNFGSTVAGDDPTVLGSFLREYFTPGGQYYDASLNFYPYAPGRGNDYSNVAASLGGYLVETLSGISFDRYCKDSVFTPLQMSHTAWFLKDLDTTLIARPYSFASGGYVDNGLYTMRIYPAAQLRTTVPSLARFLMANMDFGALGGSRILDSATVRLMRTRWVPWDPYDGFGLIWMNTVCLGRQCWGHGGGSSGAVTQMIMSEENSTGVIWLSNYDGDIPWDAVTEHLMATADTLYGIQEHPKFDKGILLVNGADFPTYGNEISTAYQDKIFTGDYPISFWDCFPSAPAGGYPSMLPAPVGRGAISLQTLGDYSTVVWVGNAYNGDWGVWSASPILSYLFLGGNVILLTKQGSSFVNSVMNDYLGFTWAETGQTLTSTAAAYSSLMALHPLGSQTLNDVFSTTLVKGESKLLYTGTGGFSGERGIGVWTKPPSGGLARSSGGNFVYIAGRPYRWNHADLRASMEFILKNLMGEVVSVREDIAAATPVRYFLEQNYPNPFNPSTMVGYQLPRATDVRLALYDVLGREVALLLNERRASGSYQVRFDASGLASGVYFYRLTAGPFVETKKMIVAK